MAIRFSFEDNFIGRIYGASFGTKKLISNPPPPAPKNSRGPMHNTKSDQQNPAVYWVLSVSCLRLTKLIFTYYDQLCRFQCVFLI